MNHYDVVVIGAGLGGLLSAVFLAKEGKKVAVIEQNKQIGGCLQPFSFDKKVFESCVHYMGALDVGQTQNSIFKYAGIRNDLKLKRLDENCFDEIIFGSEKISYPQAQGNQNFIQQLLPHFPHEEKALNEYIQLLNRVGDAFPMYQLRMGSATEKDWVRDWNLSETMKKITNNTKLQNVLVGNNLLYAGNQTKTPFYVHALVIKSYIDSTYKSEVGSSGIAKLLWRQLQKHGGIIFKKEKVNQLKIENGLITQVQTEKGTIFSGNQFISNVHPQQLLEWIDSPLIKSNYRNRINNSENSISAFMLNIVLKPKRIKHINHNIYWNRSSNAFAAIENNATGWPKNYALYFGEDIKNSNFSDTLTILTYMDSHLFKSWNQSHNRSANSSDRGSKYHQFKQMKAEILLKTVAERYPELVENIQSFKIASPLTFRDYMGTKEGSIYGIMTNVNQPMQSIIPAFTKIKNLFLTGQNIGMHGVLGVSISAVNTCSAILGTAYLLNKIGAEN